MKSDWRARLDVELEASQSYRANKADWLDGRWAGFKVADVRTIRGAATPASTSRRFAEIGRKITEVPQNFTSTAPSSASSMRAARRLRPARVSTGRRPRRLHSVRCCSRAVRSGCPGQDSERGTFSQRHSVLVDQENENRYTPFNNIGPRAGALRGHQFDAVRRGGARLRIRLFARRAECAHPVGGAVRRFRQRRPGLFDQFISSGERKWLRMSGLVCLLPHGYEGQGPEHSSARLERFLQMSAEDNMQVANCTTPANYFHILRRQLKREIRKPLILMTPKSLLRHKRAVSPLAELGRGEHVPPRAVGRCAGDGKTRSGWCPTPRSGASYCVPARSISIFTRSAKSEGTDDIYLLRVEQLYPFP